MFKYSDEHRLYLKSIKLEKVIIFICRFLIIFIFFGLWELFATLGFVNTFLFSSPSLVITTIKELVISNNLFNHIGVTLFEVLISFILGSSLGFIIASILWRYKIVAKILEPFLTILNSLPKVALGPLIIIWFGASLNSIIFMALLISLFITVINLYTGFNHTNANYIKYLNSLNASKFMIYKIVVVPSNFKNIINTFKINISMTLIGVIMGELLVSKSGLGYLIMYGSQVFNISLVITSIIILALISSLMYIIVEKIELYLIRKY